jgi:N-acyl homoserine lactone hydrolase
MTNWMRRAGMALLPLALLGARAPDGVELWRLDCGRLWVANLDEYSDTRAYVGQSRRFAASCYLIRHGDSYLLWDTGLSKDSLGKPLTEGRADSGTLRITLVDQLASLGVRPEQITTIGISHYHFDHVGQAADFPSAKLLMGKGDLEVVRTPGSPRAKPLAPWIGGGGAVEEISGDKDVFGDGRVVILDLPGHTPGHKGLLVKLERAGAVLLSGDVAHVRENLDSSGVPSFNVDRARSLASMDRFRQLARNLKATVIVQHDERDVAKLPAFPAAAN